MSVHISVHTSVYISVRMAVRMFPCPYACRYRYLYSCSRPRSTSARCAPLHMSAHVSINKVRQCELRVSTSWDECNSRALILRTAAHASFQKDAGGSRSDMSILPNVPSNILSLWNVLTNVPSNVLSPSNVRSNVPSLWRVLLNVPSNVLCSKAEFGIDELQLVDFTKVRSDVRPNVPSHLPNRTFHLPNRMPRRMFRRMFDRMFYAGLGRLDHRTSLCRCVRSCVRACVRPCVRCVRCVRACVRSRMHACMDGWTVALTNANTPTITNML